MCARVSLFTGVCLVWWFIERAFGECLLPQHPTHGRHFPLGLDCGGAKRPTACDGTPGSLVPEDWLLVVVCDPGYQHLDPNAADVPSVCSNGVWSMPQLPNCIMANSQNKDFCKVPEPPPNAQYRKIGDECGNVTVSPGSNVPLDCILILYCLPGYHQQEGEVDYLIHCHNKSWYPSIIPSRFCKRNTSHPVTSAPNTPTPPTDPPTQAPPTAPPTPVTSTTKGCVLPNQSPSRKFCSLNAGCAGRCNFYDDSCIVPPGRRVFLTKVVCAEGYTTRNQDNVNICLENSWFPSIPECLKLCPPLQSEMLQMTCRHGTNIVNCSQPALPDTTVSLECAPAFSEYPDLTRQGVYRRIHTCKSSGEWSDTLPLCKPACGVFNRDIQEFSQTIFGGEKAYLGFFPWHAGLYYRMEKNGDVFWDQQCGGSLISDRFVLTAAHCVNGVIHDVSLLRIALGKYFRPWDRNEQTQEKRSVSAIRIPSQYVSATVTFDIALVLLSERIIFGKFIMPVCLDFDYTKNYFQDSNLYVVGWGKTSVDGPASDELLFNQVTALPENECRKAVPVFYNTFEKICAAKSAESVTQQGDSGGGLTAVYWDNLHYLVGIVSSRVNNVSIFTNVKWKTHIDWMETEIRLLENSNRT